jgi:cell division protease FtsH
VQRSDKEERYTRQAREIEADIMISLGSRAVEEEFLQTKLTGADSDMQTATSLAMSYVGLHAMGPSLLSGVSGGMAGGYPEPVLRTADRLLDELYADTRRLVRDKAEAVHAVANALLDKQELIGEELDEIYTMAEEAHPELKTEFVRKVINLPKPFDEKSMRSTETVSLPEVAAVAATPRAKKKS